MIGDIVAAPRAGKFAIKALREWVYRQHDESD